MIFLFIYDISWGQSRWNIWIIIYSITLFLLTYHIESDMLFLRIAYRRYKELCVTTEYQRMNSGFLLWSIWHFAETSSCAVSMWEANDAKWQYSNSFQDSIIQLSHILQIGASQLLWIVQFRTHKNWDWSSISVFELDRVSVCGHDERFI